MAVLPPDPVFCLKGDMGHIHSMCFMDMNYEYTSNLFAACESGFVHFWDLETNRCNQKQKMGESVQVIHSSFSDILTQEKEGIVKLWSLHDGTGFELQKTYNCGGGYCKSLLFDSFLIVPQENSTLDVVYIKDMECVKKLTSNLQKLGSVMCIQKVELNESVYILAGFESGDIILWDFVSAKACSHLKLRESITSLTFDPITGRGICGNSSNKLQIFTIDKSYSLSLKCEISIANEGCSTVKLRPDRKIFVSGGWDGRLRLFSWKSLRLLVVLSEHRASITDVQFSPKTVKLWNSNIMAASAADGIISLWNLYN